MTDDKIITAFKICSGDKSCKKCPYEDYCETGGNLDVLVLDMIERYADAIERYKCVIKLLEADVREAKRFAFKELGHKLIDMADSNGAVYVGDICAWRWNS